MNLFIRYELVNGSEWKLKDVEVRASSTSFLHRRASLAHEMQILPLKISCTVFDADFCCVRLCGCVGLALHRQTVRNVGLGSLARIFDLMLLALWDCNRSKNPIYRMIIMNQKSAENVMEELSGVSLVEVAKDQQLIYWKNSNGSVLGLWFYDSEEVASPSFLCKRTQAHSIQYMHCGIFHLAIHRIVFFKF